VFSRRVVGWSMNANMTAQLVADALLMAVWRRGKPDALMTMRACAPIRFWRRSELSASDREFSRVKEAPEPNRTRMHFIGRSEMYPVMRKKKSDRKPRKGGLHIFAWE
jgi:transposase InsO family protein